ncbi:DUF2058 domain-containing protein [Wenzhouxiangella limi]|uniref:DUF2058 domain-containing protein n=1 Tax=Wenzhouxiangella limi TaxID=2707351 RepID=A0A845V2I5_9GAMM|nr:DUF2058 family protein [Wenzhouxiangella limi]NDY96914.1 DUF2058 domain-containing protein [Wenzhouxiangella limi]
MGSLQDALLNAGLTEEKPKPSRRKPRPARKAGVSGRAGSGKQPRAKAGKRRPMSAAESDLARAYKAREQAEAAEKERIKKERVAAQEARRKRNLQLDALISGQTLNRKDADCPRYFEHLGRIRRVLCTPEQREQLNNGELGVVSLRGSYLLVSLETMEAFRAIAPDLVPDLSPKEPEDDGSDYPPVPDDLVW